MLTLDQIRLESARLAAELAHLPQSKFPATHAVVSARLAALKRAEQAWERDTAAQRASYAPDPAWEEQKRQERIAAIRSGIPPLQGELARTPAWDWQKRQQLEGAIANYESQVQELEVQAV